MTYLLTGLLLGGLAAWLWTSSREFKKNLTLQKSLEAKLRFSENRMLDLQEKLGSAQSEVQLLKKSLGEEREARGQAVVHLQEFRQNAAVLGGVFLIAGLLSGGMVGWFWSGARSEAMTLRQINELQITAKISEVKAEILEKQLNRIQDQYLNLRRRWQQEKEESLIKQTKLDLLLQSTVVSSAGNGLSLDYKKMKKDLESKNDSSVFRKESGFLGFLPRF